MWTLTIIIIKYGKLSFYIIITSNTFWNPTSKYIYMSLTRTSEHTTDANYYYTDHKPSSPTTYIIIYNISRPSGRLEKFEVQ